MPLLAGRIKALDLRPFATGARDHDPDNLVALLHHLDIGPAVRRLRRNVVCRRHRAVHGAQLRSVGGFLTEKKGFHGEGLSGMPMDIGVDDR